MNNNKTVELGWREWISLPDLGVVRLLAKVDTGAKTCALHAFYVEPFDQDGERWVRFGLHPSRMSTQEELHCIARINDHRAVRDSSGNEELRYVIETPITIGAGLFTCEMTLTNRDSMRYRFLLGRNALRGRYTIDPARSCILGKPVEVTKT
jgi:hypothetical protein